MGPIGNAWKSKSLPFFHIYAFSFLPYEHYTVITLVKSGLLSASKGCFWQDTRFVLMCACISEISCIVFLPLMAESSHSCEDVDGGGS